MRDAAVRANHTLGGAYLRRRLKFREGGLFRVLCLHRIPDLAKFRRQIRLLKEHYEFRPLRELLAGDLPKNQVRLALTFDDGYPEQFERAAPVLREEGVPATFFVISSTIDLPGTEATTFYQNRVGVDNDHAPTSAMLASLAQDPLFEIGSHSSTHPDMGQVIRHNHLLKELQASKNSLESIIGEQVNSFAYPFGGQANVAPGVCLALQEAGFSYGFTIRPGFNSARTNRYMLHRDSLGPETDERLLLAWLAGGYDDLKSLTDALRSRMRLRRTVGETVD